MKTGLLFAFFFVAASSNAQNSYRIFPSAVTQTEPVVAEHPTNPSIMFVSGVTINTSSGFKSEGVYVTTNGGVSWFGSDSCKGELITNHGGDAGLSIDGSGRLILTHIGSIFPGVYSHYSTNLGATWSSAVTVSSQQPEDKGTSSIDNTPSSPYYGRVYAAFVNFSSPYPLFTTFTSNGGASWAASVAINSPPPSRCSGGFIRTAVDGSVYVCWAGLTSTSPFPEDFVGFASSTNGGTTWQVSQNIFDVNGINGTLPSKSNIKVNGLPHIEIDKSGGLRNGWLYIVTTEKDLSPAGSDADIILRRSTNGGVSWSNALRVNQDAASNGKIQYFPAIHVDALGGVNILFYDDRNTSSDSAEVFLARSIDGGITWYERLVSDHRFKPKPIIGGSSNYQGDHIALTSANGKLYPFWMDDYSGIYQIWTNPISLTTLDVAAGGNTKTKAFKLEQNYPNPFNPATTIRFQIPIPQPQTAVTLRVFDLLGREVALLIDEVKGPGEYEVRFDANGLPSGMYFYKLTAGSFHQTKKMLLIR